MTSSIQRWPAILLTLLLASCGDEAAQEVAVPSWAKVAPEQIAEAAKHGVPVAFENDIGMRFVLIPAGTFLMGSPGTEQERDDDETLHRVTISRPFYMQTTEVTNGQYRRMSDRGGGGSRRCLHWGRSRRPWWILGPRATKLSIRPSRQGRPAKPR